MPAISIPHESFLDEWGADDWRRYILKLYYSKTVGLLHADPHPLINPLETKDDIIIIRGRESGHGEDTFKNLAYNDKIQATHLRILDTIRQKCNGGLMRDIEQCAQRLFKPKLLQNLKTFHPHLDKHFSSCVLKCKSYQDTNEASSQKCPLSFSVCPEEKKDCLSFCPFGEHRTNKYRKVFFYLHVYIGEEGKNDDLCCSLKYTCLSCSRGIPPKSTPLFKFTVQ